MTLEPVSHDDDEGGDSQETDSRDSQVDMALGREDHGGSPPHVCRGNERSREARDRAEKGQNDEERCQTELPAGAASRRRGKLERRRVAGVDVPCRLRPHDGGRCGPFLRVAQSLPLRADMLRLARRGFLLVDDVPLRGVDPSDGGFPRVHDARVVRRRGAVRVALRTGPSRRLPRVRSRRRGARMPAVCGRRRRRRGLCLRSGLPHYRRSGIRRRVGGRRRRRSGRRRRRGVVCSGGKRSRDIDCGRGHDEHAHERSTDSRLTGLRLPCLQALFSSPGPRTPEARV